MFSKADLLEEEFDAADELLSEALTSGAPAGDDRQAPVNGRHVDRHGLRNASTARSPLPVESEVQQAAPPESELQGGRSGGTAETAGHTDGDGRALPGAGTATDMAAALPRAVRASSVTGAGLNPLKVT